MMMIVAEWMIFCSIFPFVNLLLVSKCWMAGILMDLDSFLVQKLPLRVHKLVIFFLIVFMAIDRVTPQTCPEA